jgi:hypothetical protein
VDWIDLALDRDKWWVFVKWVMNFRVSVNVGNFLTSLRPFGFSGRSLLCGVVRYVLSYVTSFPIRSTGGTSPYIVCLGLFKQVTSPATSSEMQLKT